MRGTGDTILAEARGATRLRVRPNGRPSEPDLGNTSVGKREQPGTVGLSAALPYLFMGAAFLLEDTAF
jgi:hypothetical protein